MTKFANVVPDVTQASFTLCLAVDGLDVISLVIQKRPYGQGLSGQETIMLQDVSKFSLMTIASKMGMVPILDC